MRDINEADLISQTTFSHYDKQTQVKRADKNTLHETVAGKQRPLLAHERNIALIMIRAVYCVINKDAVTLIEMSCLTYLIENIKLKAASRHHR